MALVDALPYPTACDGFDPVVFREGLNAGFISLVDAWSQPRLRLAGGERRGRSAKEAIEIGAVEPEYQSGIRTELPGPHGQ